MGTNFGGVMPFPVNDVLTVLAAVATVRVAEKLLTDVGLKVTLYVQFDPAATELPQVVVKPKAVALVPPSLPAVVIVSAAPPALVRVAVCAALVLPVPIDPKSIEGGVSAAVAVVAPVRLAVANPAEVATASMAVCVPAIDGEYDTK